MRNPSAASVSGTYRTCGSFERKFAKRLSFRRFGEQRASSALPLLANPQIGVGGK